MVEINKDLTLKIVLVCIIMFLPVLSLGAGFYGIQYYMDNHIESVEVEEKQETTKSLLVGNQNGEPIEIAEITAEVEVESYTVKLPIYTLHNIQIGSYEEPANANKKVMEIGKDGFGGYVFKDDNYKVFITTYFERKQADKSMKWIKAKYDSAYISEILIGGHTVKYTKADESFVHGYRKDLKVIHDLLQSYVDFIHKYDDTNIDRDDLSVYLITQHNEIIKLKERVSAYEVTDAMKERHETLSLYVDLLDTHFSSLKDLDTPMLKDLWNGGLQLMFKMDELN